MLYFKHYMDQVHQLFSTTYHRVRNANFIYPADELIGKWQQFNGYISLGKYLKSKILFRVYSCLKRKLSWTVHVHFVRLNATLTWANDHSDFTHVIGAVSMT